MNSVIEGDATEWDGGRGHSRRLNVFLVEHIQIVTTVGIVGVDQFADRAILADQVGEVASRFTRQVEVEEIIILRIEFEGGSDLVPQRRLSH